MADADVELTHNAIYGSSAQVGYNIGDLRRHVAVIRGMLTGLSASDTLGDIQRILAAYSDLLPATYDVRTQGAAGTPDPPPFAVDRIRLPLYRVTVTRFGPTKALVEAEYRFVFTSNGTTPADPADRINYSTGVEYVNVFAYPTSSNGVTNYLPEVTGPDVKYHMADGPRTIALSSGTIEGSLVRPEPYPWPVPVMRQSYSTSSSAPPPISTLRDVGKVNANSGTFSFGDVSLTVNERELRFDGVDVERAVDTSDQGQTPIYFLTYKYTVAAHRFKAHAVQGTNSTQATGEVVPVYTVAQTNLHDETASFPLPL